MEVVVRVPPAADIFNIGGSPCSSHYLSAPTSPSHAFNFFSFDDDDVPIGSPSAVPFGWEEKPGIPKSPKSSGTDQDFEFDFTSQSFSKASLSADELFDGGKIKPLKLPPGFQSKMWSPRPPRKAESSIDDPFEAALMKETAPDGGTTDQISYISSQTALDGDDGGSLAAAAVKSKSAISFSKANKRWRLRDLLFRSASEGRSTAKADKLRSTYVVISENMDNDVKISSFRSADGGDSRFHSTAANRTVSEELMMTKKRLLPIKPGFLGRFCGLTGPVCRRFPGELGR
ncbi:uncharacterized protein LOC111499980 isoform X2 [Cucurbita maxima]|uniref:Uncharacterized protein LOC111499980 isoform X2 n=1 Tax=Cucurbita maxima TaxID=3661 RepID=A0A6J1L553_CUCMA|nr:uncharacterized protein LOC111499980 isoform X2 [Cucurbita maxima]